MKSSNASQATFQGKNKVIDSIVAKPMFSIIMPAYNVEQYIGDAVQSIKNQTFTDFECIIIDDGSTDQGVESINRLIINDERFIVKKQKNGGLSNARNTGLKIAKGQYVLLLDSDDLFELNLLETVNSRIQATHADIVIYNHTVFDTISGHKSDPLHDFKPVKDKLTFTAESISKVIFNTFGNQVWTKAFNREFIEDHKLIFQDALKRAEDIPFTYSALLYAKHITAIDEGLVSYRVNRGDSNSDRLAEYYLDIFTSLDIIYQQLVDMRKYELFYESFQNLFIENMNYNLYSLVGTDKFVDEFKLAQKYAHKYNISSNKNVYHYSQLYEVSEFILNKNYYDLLTHFTLKEREDNLKKQTALYAKDDIVSYKNSVIEELERKNTNETEKYVALEERYNKLIKHPLLRVPLAIRRLLQKNLRR